MTVTRQRRDAQPFPGPCLSPTRAQDLSRLQHDGLRDSLLIAKRFKQRISYHFRLDAF